MQPPDGVYIMFPKLVIVRFKQAFYESDNNCYQSAVALCNALQEPGLVTNSSISLVGSIQREAASPQSLPENRPNKLISIGHVLTALVKAGLLPGNPTADIPLFHPPGSNPATSSDGKIVIQPSEGIFRNLKGIPSEVNEFRSLAPEYFFISCQLLWKDFYGDGSVRRKPLIIPVFRKDQSYYLCSGERDSLVFKVLDPIALFFSHEGHLSLEISLSSAYHSHGARVDLRGDGNCNAINRRYGQHALLSIPKLFYRGPSNWDSQR